MSTTRALVPAGARPESSIASALTLLAWPVVDVLAGDEPQSPMIVVKPPSLDAVVEINLAPGHPTVLVVTGEHAEEAQAALGELIAHLDLDTVLESYATALSPLEQIVSLRNLAGVAIGIEHQGLLRDTVSGALSSDSADIRAAAMGVAAFAPEQYRRSLVDIAAGDPEPDLSDWARELLEGGAP